MIVFSNNVTWQVSYWLPQIVYMHIEVIASTPTSYFLSLYVLGQIWLNPSYPNTLWDSWMICMFWASHGLYPQAQNLNNKTQNVYGHH
jgi:hypothetical protein